MLFRANQMVSCCIYSAGGLLFPCLFFFFSSSLYFCSQIIASLLPRGRLVPPSATKLRVPHRPYFKFARKLRVLVALLKGSSRAVSLTLGVYSVQVKTQTYELSLLWGAILPLQTHFGFSRTAVKNRRSHSHCIQENQEGNQEANANEARESLI